jgi:hypothetical protein
MAHSRRQCECCTPIFPFWDGLHHSAITGESGFDKILDKHYSNIRGRIPTLQGSLMPRCPHPTPRDRCYGLKENGPGPLLQLSRTARQSLSR